MSDASSDLGDLYQEILLDHGRRPRNYGRLEAANRLAHGSNPLCGDRFVIYAIVDDAGVVQDVRFEGRGCAISTASASLMTQVVKGQTLPVVSETCDRFHQMLTADPAPGAEGMGKLAALEGVRGFPLRVKCATLAWHTVRAALLESGSTVSTES